VIDRGRNGKETIRVSYGIFYDTPEIYYEVRFASAPPFGNQVSIPKRRDQSIPGISGPQSASTPGRRIRDSAVR
jgi:hypothetical protein